MGLDASIHKIKRINYKDFDYRGMMDEGEELVYFRKFYELDALAGERFNAIDIGEEYEITKDQLIKIIEWIYEHEPCSYFYEEKKAELIKFIEANKDFDFDNYIMVYSRSS